jgi:hypothetical protein
MLPTSRHHAPRPGLASAIDPLTLDQDGVRFIPGNDQGRIGQMDSEAMGVARR